MALKAESVANRVLAGAILLLAALPLQAGSAQQAPATPAFTIRDASALVNRLAEALEGHQAGKFLSGFDLVRMNGGQIFKQQITSFFAHADSIRVHFNVSEAGMTDNNGAATVAAEMETSPPNDNIPPVRKRATLQFVAQRTGAGWKFTDVQPRSFFSTSSAPPASPSQ